MTSSIKKSEMDFSKLTDDCPLSIEDFTEHLDLAIEMLFYIEKDTFDTKDIQNVVFVLKRIRNKLRN